MIKKFKTDLFDTTSIKSKTARMHVASKTKTRPPMKITVEKVKSELGLNEEAWKIILEKSQKSIESFNLQFTGPATKRLLTTEEIVFLVLYRLKKYCSFKELSKKMRISVELAHKIYEYGLICLSTQLKTIKFDEQCNMEWICKEGESRKIIGAIDCSDSSRCRIHLGGGTLFRVDKGHNILCQCVIDLFGQHIHHVSLWKGHNNDKAVYNMSGLPKKLEEKGLYLVSDLGYSAGRIYSTKDKEMENEFGTGFQSQIRSIIENVFGNQLLYSWKILQSKVSDSVPLHGLALRVVYEVANICLKVKAMRENWIQTMTEKM
ncbi:MAG: transposase family protein [Oceanicaulis sp.]|nr:transposase family protein [Oceanicaulis sp.]